MNLPSKAGTDATRRFYDEAGWRLRDNKSVDLHLFGLKEDGPIRAELRRLHAARVREGLSRAGTGLNLLECGCGGNPARYILDMCSRYTGIDFSERGVALARSSFSDVGIPHEFVKGDICALPFEDGTFDAVFSSHVIYHIDDAAAQNAALDEMVRVVRPGGAVVVIAANPYPLAFPGQLARGLARDMPIVGALLKRIRSKPPLPYKPQLISRMLRRFAPFGQVGVVSNDLPTTHFNQKVTEFKGYGKLRWRAIRWLDVNQPRLSAYLGNAVMLSLWKSETGISA